MSRPKPTIMFEHVDNTYRAEEILQASAVYAVCYNKIPINVRTRNVIIDYPGPKYKRSSFQNSGAAFNLAKRLNILFNTKKFAVHEMIIGPIITKK